MITQEEIKELRNNAEFHDKHAWKYVASGFLIGVVGIMYSINFYYLTYHNYRKAEQLELIAKHHNFSSQAGKEYELNKHLSFDLSNNG